jgi:hypothetical protein
MMSCSVLLFHALKYIPLYTQIADPAQEAMMEESCILVDPDDRVLGAASKRHCHLLDATGSSPLHRAFSVFAFNKAGQLLLQRRSEFKVQKHFFYHYVE